MIDFKSKSNRRCFLKKFALLSVSPGFLSACSLIPLATYGPPSDKEPISVPNPDPETAPPAVVTGIYQKDPFWGLIPLHQSQNVPVSGTFEIEFSKEMISSSINSIYLVRSPGGSISYTAHWGQNNNIVLNADHHLDYASHYSLTINEGAVDVDGNNLFLTSSAVAEFRTTSIKLSPTSVTLSLGESTTVRVLSLYKAGGELASESEWSVTGWRVDDPAIVSVESGVNLTALKEGTALLQITVEMESKEYTTTALVVVIT